MFEKSVEELTELGAQITTAEIAQQPELWRDTLNIYRENKETIEAFRPRLALWARVVCPLSSPVPVRPTTLAIPAPRTCVTLATLISTTLSPSPRPTS